MSISFTRVRQKRAVARQHISTKLLRRLQLFAIIIVGILAIGIYNIFLGQLRWTLGLLGLVSGTAIGAIAGRMFKIFWHPETQQVVSRLDKVGAVFLVLYILIEVGRKWLFGHWLTGAELNSFGLVFLAGLLLGRFLILAKNIRHVLIAEEKLVH